MCSPVLVRVRELRCDRSSLGQVGVRASTTYGAAQPSSKSSRVRQPRFQSGSPRLLHTSEI
jgi:hypothetical protein